MPFKSKAQLKKFALLEKQGKLKPGTFNRWLIETKDTKKLPEHVKKTKGGYKK